MTSKERASLKAYAVNIKPIFQIGKGGVNDNMVGDISAALDAHELIKITVLRACDYDAGELKRLLELKTGAEGVTVIGSKIVLYRRSEKEGVKHIQL